MAKKINAPGIVIPRLKQYRTLLNSILADSRITGSRRMLGMFLAAWIDLYDHPDAQKQIMSVIVGSWGDAKKTRWADEGETPVQEGQSNLDKETSQNLKNVFDLMLKESSKE